MWVGCGWCCPVKSVPTCVPVYGQFAGGVGSNTHGKVVSDVWRGSQRSLHINHLEMLAVKFALQHFRLEIVTYCTPFMRQRHRSSLPSKRGGTRSRDLCLLSWRILQICRAWETCLLVRHIPSCLNVLADSLSRSKPLPTKWQISPCLFKPIFNLLPTLHIDLFATIRNAKLPVFPSPFPEMSAKVVDVLSHS